MIAALVWAGIVFYAVLYSGVRQLQGFDISTLGALRGDVETPRAELMQGRTMGGGGPVTGKCRNPKVTRRHVHPNNVVRLIPSAMAAFLEAERIYGRHIILTGSIRTCERQAELHNGDPDRFAAPDSSAHPRGRAIDVTDHGNERIKAALRAAGWTQARPKDEPWHWSSGVTA